MHIFQIASLLVLALVFSQICWIYVIYFFKKIMYFVYIIILELIKQYVSN